MNMLGKALLHPLGRLKYISGLHHKVHTALFIELYKCAKYTFRMWKKEHKNVNKSSKNSQVSSNISQRNPFTRVEKD